MKKIEHSSLTGQTVYYKNMLCKVLYDYGNGNYEILCGEKVLFVNRIDLVLKEQSDD